MKFYRRRAGIILFLCFILLQSQHDHCATGVNTGPLDIDPLNNQTSTNTTTLKPGGLGGETCLSSEVCKRDCVRYGPLACPNGGYDCTCATAPCDTNTDCFPGEECVSNANKKFCINPNSRMMPRLGSRALGPCRNVTDCAGEGDCFSFKDQKSADVELCGPNSEGCVCLPLIFNRCTAAFQCDTDEICLMISPNTNLCSDPRFNDTAKLPAIDKLLNETKENPPTSSEEPASPQGSGLTLDSCKKDSDCAARRKCSVIKRGTSRPCFEDDSTCLCLPESIQTCVSNEQCPTGEICLRLNNANTCVSETTASKLQENSSVQQLDPTPMPSDEFDIGELDGTPDESIEETPADESAPLNPEQSTDADRVPSSIDDDPSASVLGDDGAVCVAAKHLTHLPHKELVFENHVRATVLCDKKESCASPGHIVHYKRVVMMMRTYCGSVEGGCTKKTALVNSPKWKRKLRIPSNSPDLEYTAFAARYETFIEERLLLTAVRIGL